jgi:hypothetical protein
MTEDRQSTIDDRRSTIQSVATERQSKLKLSRHSRSPHWSGGVSRIMSLCRCVEGTGKSRGTRLPRLPRTSQAFTRGRPVPGRARLTPRSSDYAACRSTSGDGPVLDESASHRKNFLLTLTSGLDRGLEAPGVDRADEVEGAILALCRDSPAVRLDIDEEVLGGTWALQYSSEFVPGNAKFAGNWPVLANSTVLRTATRPLLPRIRNVQQVIDVGLKRLDNVVTLELRPPVLERILPDLGRLLQVELQSAPVVIAKLEHDYSVSGAATVTITFEKTTLSTEGGINGWFGGLPEVSLGGDGENAVLAEIRNALKAYNSSCFDVIYVDETLRITKGDRGEYRIFTRETTSQGGELK